MHRLHWIDTMFVRSDPQQLIHLVICLLCWLTSAFPIPQATIHAFIIDFPDTFVCLLRVAAAFADIHPSIYLFIFSLVHCLFVSAA